MKTMIRSLSNGKIEVTIEDGCRTYINDKCETSQDAISWMKQKEEEIKSSRRR